MFEHQHGRRKIHFSDHALDRWWERCEQNNLHGRRAAMQHLRECLQTASWTRTVPSWSRLSSWHRARAEGSLMLSENCAFIVNRNANGDLVAVTYLEPTDALVA